ncbi:MAG TPA: hypothetical protein PLL75_02185 [Candidatus Omnitrophota bacterium]|nr:hypothetical protein [Candidatus Omnitrophota bacterium]HPS36520.1 hypothetical protein [Candidatus Omnitrophota bacterium]
MFILREKIKHFIDWAAEAKFRRSDLWLLVPYWALVWFGIWHHEPWSDEALPWMIARDSNLGEFLQIIFGNWDRHPGLFHTLLLPLAKTGLPYFSQSILNAVFTLVTAWLFLARAPFSRIFRSFFLFSYLMVYEYSVIVRPYMLAIMLLFLIADFYPKRTTKPILYALLVSLLFQSDFICFGLGAGLLLAFAIEQRKRFRGDPRTLAALGLMVASGALAFFIAHSLPANHAEAGHKLAFNAWYMVAPTINAFFPFFDIVPHSLPFVILTAVVAFSVLVMAGIFLSGRFFPLLILVISLAYLAFGFLFVQGGNYRHHGFILISLLFALWISQNYPEKDGARFAFWGKPGSFWTKKARSVAMILMTVFFVLQLQNVYFVYVLENYLPFSGAKQMAEAIKVLDETKHVFNQGFVIVAPRRVCVGLLPYLPGVKFWNPCTESFARYYYPTKELGACDREDLGAAIEKTKEKFGDLRRILFLFQQPMPVAKDGEYEYRQVVAVDRRIFGYLNERFYLYLPLRLSGDQNSIDKVRQKDPPDFPSKTDFKK